MNWIIKYFFYSNAFAVVVIASLLLQNFWLLPNLSLSYDAMWFIVSATCFLYPFHRVYGLLQLQPNAMMERHVFVKTHSFSVWALAAVGFVAAIWFGIQLPLSHWVYHMPVGLIGLLYVIPLVPINGKRAKLREVPYLKVFFIAFVVAYLTTIFVVQNLNEPTLWMVFLMRFLFLVAVTIPFDIRDYGADRVQGIKTLPIVLGIDKAIKWALLCNLIFAVVALSIFFSGAFSIPILMALIISEIYSGIWIKQAKPIKSEFWFSTRIEGSIIIQTLLLAVAGLLFL